jgi:tRNA(Ile)-lysidine synthase
METDCIATGHHQDDQAETVFFHMLRGSGLRGLQGMQAKNGPWVRPLLRESRDTLLSWADSENLNWSEDPSNPESQRGKIRSLMPVLNDFRDGASSALARSARLLAREDEYLSQMADQVWDDVSVGQALDRVQLAQQHPAIQLRLIRRLLNDVRVRADMLELVVQGALMTHGKLDLGYGVRLVCHRGQLRVERD